MQYLHKLPPRAMELPRNNEIKEIKEIKEDILNNQTMESPFESDSLSYSRRKLLNIFGPKCGTPEHSFNPSLNETTVDNEGLVIPGKYKRIDFVKLLGLTASSLFLTHLLPSFSRIERQRDELGMDTLQNKFATLGINLNNKDLTDNISIDIQYELLNLLDLTDDSLVAQGEMNVEFMTRLYQNVLGPLPFISRNSKTGLFIAKEDKWKTKNVTLVGFGNVPARVSVFNQYFTTTPEDFLTINPSYTKNPDQGNKPLHISLTHYGYDRVLTISDQIFKNSDTESRAEFERNLRIRLITQYLSSSVDQYSSKIEVLNPQFQALIRNMGGSFHLQRTSPNTYAAVCESIMTGNLKNEPANLCQEDIDIMIEFIEKNVLFGNTYSFDKSTSMFESIDPIIRPDLFYDDFANELHVIEVLNKPLNEFNEKLLKEYNVVVNDPTIIEEYRQFKNSYMDAVQLTKADFEQIETILSKLKAGGIISDKKIMFFLGYFNNDVSDSPAYCYPYKVKHADGYITLPYYQLKLGSENDTEARIWVQGAFTHEYGHAKSLTQGVLDPLYTENGGILSNVMPINENQLHEIFDLSFKDGKWIQSSESGGWDYAGLDWMEFWASMIETYTEGRSWFTFVYGKYFDNYDNRIRMNVSLSRTVDRFYQEMKDKIFHGNEYIRGNDQES